MCFVHICQFKGQQLERGIILHTMERLGTIQSLFFIFVLSPMSHFWNKCIVMFYAFLQCTTILKLRQIIKYKWDVNYLSKHNKNIVQHGMLALNVGVRAPYEGLSEEKLE